MNTNNQTPIRTIGKLNRTTTATDFKNVNNAIDLGSPLAKENWQEKQLMSARRKSSHLLNRERPIGTNDPLMATVTTSGQSSFPLFFDQMTTNAAKNYIVTG